MTPPTSRKTSRVTPPTPRRTSNVTPPTPRLTSQTRSMSKDVGINDSLDEISGVNKNLCSLAQSYFSNPQKPVSRKSSVVTDNRHQTPDNRQSFPAGSDIQETSGQSVGTVGNTQNDEKASLVASFFGGNKLPKKRDSVSERASFLPADELLPLDDDEDDELDRIIRSSKEVDPPPVPPRKVDKQALILKMMGNVNGILAGKR